LKENIEKGILIDSVYEIIEEEVKEDKKAYEDLVGQISLDSLEKKDRKKKKKRSGSGNFDKGSKPAQQTKGTQELPNQQTREGQPRNPDRQQNKPHGRSGNRNRNRNRNQNRNSDNKDEK